MPYYLRRFDGALSRVLGARCDSILRKHVEDRCCGRYAQSNTRTVEMTGLPLADLGYELWARLGWVFGDVDRLMLPK